MSAFTKVNLADVENMSAKRGLSDDLDARFAKGPLELEKTGLSYQHLSPGARMPFGHRHMEQEEIYVIIAGAGRAKLEDEIIDVVEHDCIRVPGPTARAFEAGPDGLTLLAFGAPSAAGASPGADAEVLPGWWKD